MSSSSPFIKLSTIFEYQLQLIESTADKATSCTMSFVAGTYALALCVAKIVVNLEDAS